MDAPRPGEPDSGARRVVACDARGIEITASGPGFTRHGLVTWPQAASWIDAGVIPARLGIIILADRLSAFCRSHRDQLIAAGTCDPGTAITELDQIRDTTIAMVIDAALRARGAAAPVPAARPGEPAYYTAAMITRPGRGAGKAENTALERLTELRAMVREPQPLTTAEIRAAIRRWIGYGLPDYVRALGNPGTMRAWISGQASRPAEGSYDSSGERWYGASPDGLLTDRRGDDRAPALIRWEEISAWIQPGITSSLRDRLITADDARRAVFGRMITAAAHPHASLDAPGDEEDKQSAQRHREAIDAAWGAIEAAPPPAPAQLEYARRAYRDTSPVEQTLFDAPELDSTRVKPSPPQPAPSGPGTRTGAPSRMAKASIPETERARHQDPASQPAVSSAQPGPVPAPADVRHPDAELRDQHVRAGDPQAGTGVASPATAPGLDAGATARSGAEPARERHGTPAPAQAGPRRQPAAAPAAQPQPGITSTPLTADDIFLGLGRLPVFVFADLFFAIDAGQPLDSVSRLLAPHARTRAAGEPDAGARETVTPVPAGVRIQVATANGTRAGLLSWAEVADRVQPGLTPGRRQTIVQACRTELRFAAAGASFRAIGEGSLAVGAERELRNLAKAAVTTMLDVARTGARRRGGQPPRQPADDEAAALQRITDLANALPAQPPRPRTPVSQVTAGDIIGHPGYKLQPFRVSAPPRHHGTQVEITGSLTEPSGDEPAGEITVTLSADRHPNPVVSVIPVPARSLRTLLPAAGTLEDTGQRRTAGHGTTAIPDAQPAARTGLAQPPPRPSRHQQAACQRRPL